MAWTARIKSVRKARLRYIRGVRPPMNAAPNASARLIVALDVATVAEARAIVGELPGVSFYKIGLTVQWDRRSTASSTI